MRTFVRRKSTLDAGEDAILLFDNTSQLEFYLPEQKDRDHVATAISDSGKKYLTLDRRVNYLFPAKISAEKNHPKTLEFWRCLGDDLQEELNRQKVKSITVIDLTEDQTAGLYVAEGIVLGNYQFLKYFTNPVKKQRSLRDFHLISRCTDDSLLQLNAALDGTLRARDLSNEPLSTLTAPRYAEIMKEWGTELGLKVTVLEKKQIESLKMGGLLAVNRGSIDPPTFTIMEWAPQEAVNSKPIVLVGKGVVYDTGGLSLKPTANSMDFMKVDMAGSAAVVGAMVAIAESNVPVHVIGLVPATDNRPGQNAYAPGDVITMYDGTTVEVLNTDAEGRLIMADALAYAKKFDPELVIDLATLTGSAAAAIGKYGIVAMGNADETVWNELHSSADEVHERLARLPFWSEYRNLLDSDIADLKNIGGPEGGAITAGKFLEHFTDYPYVHFDIAGPSWLKKKDHYRTKNATGVGVRILFHYFMQRARKGE